MEKITQQIMGLMSRDYYFLIVMGILLITIICLLCGILLAFFKGKLEILFLGIIGICFIFIHISTFDERDPNKFFQYRQKDNEIIEIKSNNPLFKENAEFKIIQNDDEITLKNLITNEESKPIDKEDFYKIIRIRKSHENKENANDKLENKKSKAFYRKLLAPLEDAFGIKERQENEK